MFPSFSRRRSLRTLAIVVLASHIGSLAMPALAGPGSGVVAAG